MKVRAVDTLARVVEHLHLAGLLNHVPARGIPGSCSMAMGWVKLGRLANTRCVASVTELLGVHRPRGSWCSTAVNPGRSRQARNWWWRWRPSKRRIRWAACHCRRRSRCSCTAWTQKDSRPCTRWWLRWRWRRRLRCGIRDNPRRRCPHRSTRSTSGRSASPTARWSSGRRAPSAPWYRQVPAQAVAGSEWIRRPCRRTPQPITPAPAPAGPLRAGARNCACQGPPQPRRERLRSAGLLAAQHSRVIPA